MYYFISLVFMMLSSGGTFLSDYEVSFFLLEVVLIWVGIEHKRFTKNDFNFFGRFTLLYTLFVVARYFFFNNNLLLNFLVSDFIFLVKYILLAFLYCAVFKDKALYYMIRVIVFCAAVSLPLYLFEIVAGDALFSIGKIFYVKATASTPYTNFFVFTYTKAHPIQNSGFSWEPGASGCLMNITLLFLLITNGFVFDKKAWILVGSIVITLSTTSYIALMIILMIYYRANGGRMSTLLFIAVPVLGVVAFKVPFLIDKIVQIYNHDLKDIDDMQNLSRFYLRAGRVLPLNRFGSVIYLYRLFDIKLIWGVCNDYKGSQPTLFNVSLSNGLIDFIAKFGLVGIVYLIRCYIKLIKKFVWRNELAVYGVLVLLIVSFGEPILIFPSCLAFLFLYHYTDASTWPVSTNEDADFNLEQNGSGASLWANGHNGAATA